MEDEYQIARELALKRLSLREHSAQELRTYLKGKLIKSEIISDLINELKAEKVLDERRFARAVARTQAVREKGPGYIRQKLQQSGVPIDLSEARQLFSESSDHDEKELARRIVERRYPRAAQDPNELRRAYAALLRRGFSIDAAKHALSGRTPPEAEIIEDSE